MTPRKLATRFATKHGITTQHSSDLRTVWYFPHITIGGVRYYGPKQTTSMDAIRFARDWADGRLSPISR